MDRAGCETLKTDYFDFNIRRCQDLALYELSGRLTRLGTPPADSAVRQMYYLSGKLSLSLSRGRSRSENIGERTLFLF